MSGDNKVTIGYESLRASRGRPQFDQIRQAHARSNEEAMSTEAFLGVIIAPPTAQPFMEEWRLAIE